MGKFRTAVCVVVTAVLARMAWQHLGTKLPIHHGGYAAPGWEKVLQVFQRQVEDGIQRGGAFSVYQEGEPVVEVWGGYADDSARVAWNSDTLSVYCSATKALSALVIEMLADQGHVDYSAPVVKYWPEFAQNGKDRITVAQLLSHQAGLVLMDEKFSVLDFKNRPDVIGDSLAAQKPMWPPGEGFGYHAMTFGLLVDQLVRRVDPQKRNLGDFFRDEVSIPFDVDFFIGLPKSENYRVARVVPEDVFSLDAIKSMMNMWHLTLDTFSSDSVFNKFFENQVEMAYFADSLNNPYIREVPLGSVNGFGTASSTAKLMGIIANGGIANGKQLLSPERIRHFGTPLINGTDRVMKLYRKYGPGTSLHQAVHGGQILGHEGFGHQMAFADPKMHLGWSYVTNHFFPYFFDAPFYLELVDAMYECALGIQEAKKKA